MAIVLFARLLNRDHMKIIKFTDSPNRKRRRSDKSLFRAVHRSKHTCLKQSMSWKRLTTSRKVFEDAGVTLQCRATRCKVLKAFRSIKKPKKQPHLSKFNMQKLLVWVKTHLKLDFQNAVFTDECRATLEGPDGNLQKLAT